MHTGMMNLLCLTYDQLTEQFHRRYQRGAYHASAVYRAFYHDAPLNLANLQIFDNATPLRRRIETDMSLRLPAVARKVQQDGVTKLVLALHDGLRIETVIIPMANHATVCISCQVGCRMGCRFCETAQMGWRRNLTADEIVSQVFMVKVQMGIDVRNVVFMGMGEPLDNYEAVIQAIRVLEDQRGLNIAKRHITLSTAGLVPAIRRLAARKWPQLKLAVSLNAPNDGLRNTLMPINRSHPMSELKEVLTSVPLARGNALLMEYVLIKGINDRPEHARQLAEYLRGLKAKLNLIPYNPRRRSPFDAPSHADVERFKQLLIDQRIFVRLRRSKGSQIRAACGQLGADQSASSHRNEASENYHEVHEGQEG